MKMNSENYKEKKTKDVLNNEAKSDKMQILNSFKNKKTKKDVENQKNNAKETQKSQNQAKSKTTNEKKKEVLRAGVFDGGKIKTDNIRKSVFFQNFTEKVGDKASVGNKNSEKNKKINNVLSEKKISKTEEDIVKEVVSDYEKRKNAKRGLEQAWLLNMNFLVGNQFSYINSAGEIDEISRTSTSESREVFNHIAPIVESRLAKLGRVKPSFAVRPASTSESDLETAKITKKILDSVGATLNISNIMTDATMWSEVTGTSFYKLVWDAGLGTVVGFKTSTGEVLNVKQVEKIKKIIGEGKNLFVNAGGLIFDEEGQVFNSSEKIKSISENDFKKQLEEADNLARGSVSELDNLGEVDKTSASKGEGEKFSKDNKTNSSNLKSGSFGEDILGLKTGDGDLECGFRLFDLSELVPVFDGDVDISVCSPFEIFPESASVFEVSDQPSIIHAHAVDVNEFEEYYGVKANAETLNTISLDNTLGSDGFLTGRSSIKKVVGERVDNLVLVIERWIKPNKIYKNGRLTVVGGGNLLYDGDMPYAEYPFVKQVSNRVVGSFWGVSVVERCIPIQRAYNSVKNRKLECMGRLCGGVLAVEEGSVDVADLEENGLLPGKILVYRNGASLPMFMNAGSIPRELSEEEERLSNELISVSGVSELMRNSTLPSQVNSGTAISLLIEQDDTRLSVTAENIRTAMLELSKNILNLYKLFVDGGKLAKITDECGRLQIFYWNKSDITSSDIVLETANELSESLSNRKQMVLELLKYGLLQNDDGRLDERTKNKVIEMLGFGNWENGADETALQVSRAKMENVASADLMVLEVDNHNIHIKEHTKHILEIASDGVVSEKVLKLLKHINDHKMILQNEKR